jgi:hypothetical protein
VEVSGGSFVGIYLKYAVIQGIGRFEIYNVMIFVVVLLPRNLVESDTLLFGKESTGRLKWWS